MRKHLGLASAILILAGMAFAVSGAGAQERASSATHTLKATPKTVAWGYYDAAAEPVLRIQSGDSVVFETLLTNSPAGLEKAGLPADQVQQNLRDIYKEIATHGPGGHILNGPVYIEGAEPGDTLEVQIQKIDLAIPYACNGFRFGAGFLTQDFTYSRTKIIPLDRERMVAAPPEPYGRISSAPPGIHAGNMDNKELVAGTTLYLPVHARGALFEIGDGHAGQGDGEVDITALETSLTGRLQFIVRKDLKTKYPRAETPTHYICMGFDDDLSEATRIAVREMIDFLVMEKHLARDDAYMLASVAADLHITELVDGNKGVHMMIPKAIFTSAKSGN